MRLKSEDGREVYKHSEEGVRRGNTTLMHSHSSFLCGYFMRPLCFMHVMLRAIKCLIVKTDTFLFATTNHAATFLVVRNAFWRISAWNLQHIINLLKCYKFSVLRFLLQPWYENEANMCWLCSCTCRVNWLDCVSFWLSLHARLPDFPSTSSSSWISTSSRFAVFKIHFTRWCRIFSELDMRLAEKHESVLRMFEIGKKIRERFKARPH